MGLAQRYTATDVRARPRVRALRSEGTPANDRWETAMTRLPSPQDGPRPVLLVDDDPQVRGFLSRTLTMQGLQVLEAAHEGDALTILVAASAYRVHLRPYRSAGRCRSGCGERRVPAQALRRRTAQGDAPAVPRRLASHRRLRAPPDSRWPVESATQVTAAAMHGGASELLGSGEGHIVTYCGRCDGPTGPGRPEWSREVTVGRSTAH